MSRLLGPTVLVRDLPVSLIIPYFSSEPKKLVEFKSNLNGTLHHEKPQKQLTDNSQLTETSGNILMKSILIKNMHAFLQALKIF